MAQLEALEEKKHRIQAGRADEQDKDSFRTELESVAAEALEATKQLAGLLSPRKDR
jgi:hypothetical protein